MDDFLESLLLIFGKNEYANIEDIEHFFVKKTDSSL